MAAENFPWISRRFVHSGDMNSIVDATRAEAALLSAATPSQGDATEPPSLLKIAGEPLIAYQIRALAQAGIQNFLIEVDQVPGALLALCDDARRRGLAIEFVRSTQELSSKLPDGVTLIVQGEGIYLDPALLRKQLAFPSAFVLTVDGRDENGGFERMDLNTRWAGLARVDMAVVRSVANLPSGWSMASSLLRQAIQQNVAQCRLPQGEVQQARLQLVANTSAADILTTDVLAKRAETVGGIVESRLFAPIAARLARPFWRGGVNKALVPVATLSAALGCLSLGFLGFGAASAVAALVSIFGLTLNATLADPGRGGFAGKWLTPAIWLALAAALAGASTRNSQSGVDDMFAVAVFVGLLIHVRQIDLPSWARNVLISLALMATVLLGFAAIGQIGLGVKLMAVLQILILLVVGFSGSRGSPE